MLASKDYKDGAQSMCGQHHPLDLRVPSGHQLSAFWLVTWCVVFANCALCCRPNLRPVRDREW